LTEGSGFATIVVRPLKGFLPTNFKSPEHISKRDVFRAFRMINREIEHEKQGNVRAYKIRLKTQKF